MSHTTQPSSPPSTLLSNLDAEDLERQGLLLPRSPGSPGTRRLHKRILNEYSDEEYRHLPLSAPDIPPDAFVTIPDVLISRETLLYVGLSEAEADEVWQYWTNWPTGDMVEFPRETDSPEGDCVFFLDIILNGIKGGQDADDNTDASWYKCMDDCGISPELQSAIMDSGSGFHDEIRLSNSCLYWVVDTIDMRYAGLEEIQRTSLARDKKLRRQSSQDSQQCQRPQETPSIGRNVWSSAQAQAARNVPGHTVLFKAIHQACTHNTHTRLDILDEAGNLQHISNLISGVPSDFSRYQELVYFAADPLVAEYHASYAKRRSMMGSVVIVSVAIPNSAFETLREPDDVQRRFFPNPDWKDLVWFSRQWTILPSTPSYLEHRRGTALIIGTISDGLFGQNMVSREGVSERNVFKVGRRRGEEAERRHAIQYAFTPDHGLKWLEDNGSFKVATYTAEDAQALCKEYIWAE